MKQLLNLLFVLLITSSCFSQSDVSAWLTDGEVNGITLKVLRIPSENAAPHLKYDIVAIQKQLDKCRKAYESGAGVELSTIQFNFDFIKNRDTGFPLHYYIKEVEAYEAYNKVYSVKARERRDQRMKEILDSAKVAELAKGHVFINKEFVWVKEKPQANSRSIGKIYLGSYVKAYNIFDENKFIQIEFGSFSGYIADTNIVYSLKELTLPADRRAKLESGRYYNFEPTAAYQAQLDREEKAEEAELRRLNAAPGRKYIRGPMNGCYYINKNGNRQYVDRSYCD